MYVRVSIDRLTAAALPLLVLAFILLASLALSPVSAFALGIPAMVKDIAPGSAASTPDIFLPVGNKLFFVSNDFVVGVEPWVSDGTPAGTTLLKDVWAGPGDGSCPGAISIAGTVYFCAYDGSNGSQLWRTDGTTAGTMKVYSGSTASDLTNVGGSIYFAGTPIGEYLAFLYRSDGTAGGTVQVTTSTYPAGRDITDVNGTAFFPASDGVTGVEIWKTDGTAGGTSLVKDLAPGGADSYAQSLTNVGGTLFFKASNGTIFGLFKSDGTGPGTVLVKALSMPPDNLVDADGTVFLIGIDPAYGAELWKSDGTTAGTVMVKDIYPGAGGGLSGSSLVAIGSVVYFSANDAAHGAELWKSDGTEAGTVMVKDIYPDFGAFGSSWPVALTNAGGRLFFRAMSNEAEGTQPWTSDGTEAGTVQIASLYPAGNSLAASFTSVNGNIFFAATDDTHGVELWSVSAAVTGVGAGGRDVPGTVSLSQNDPNPVRSTTRVAYALPVSQMVVLKLYDARGRELRTLVNQEQSAGTHRFELDATSLSSGVYFYRLEAGRFVETRSVTVIR